MLLSFRYSVSLYFAVFMKPSRFHLTMVRLWQRLAINVIKKIHMYAVQCDKWTCDLIHVHVDRFFCTDACNHVHVRIDYSSILTP